MDDVLSLLAVQPQMEIENAVPLVGIKITKDHMGRCFRPSQFPHPPDRFYMIIDRIPKQWNLFLFHP
jgi:hypothetical protein